MRVKKILALTMAVAASVMSGPGVWAASYTGGPGRGDVMDVMTSDVHLGGAVVTLSSAANQIFTRGYVPMAISMITITDDPATPSIKNGTPIVVWIPDGFAMTWDETDLTATFGGTAALKVGTISYTNSNQRLVIAVTADFSAGDTLTISALSFKNYIGFGSTRLELDYDNDGVADTQDDKNITILSIYSGGQGDSYALDQMIIDKSLAPPSGTILTTR